MSQTHLTRFPPSRPVCSLSGVRALWRRRREFPFRGTSLMYASPARISRSTCFPITGRTLAAAAAFSSTTLRLPAGSDDTHPHSAAHHYLLTPILVQSVRSGRQHSQRGTQVTARQRQDPATSQPDIFARRRPRESVAQAYRPLLSDTRRSHDASMTHFKCSLTDAGGLVSH